MNKNFTLLTLTQGNPIALKRTIDSLEGIIDQVVVGSVSIFQDDAEEIKKIGDNISMNFVELPFNYLFKYGFSSALNLLSTYAHNDNVMYLNVGEVLISDKNELRNRISPSYNCYYIDHPVEKHHWYRVYNRKEMQWNGIIHEEIVGDSKPCSVPLFTFDDTPKDSDDKLKAWVYEQVKELVYWNLYVKLVDQPHLATGTNHGWVDFSRDGYHSFIERLHQKGDMYEAMIRGDYELLMKAINQKKEYGTVFHLVFLSLFPSFE